MVLAIRRRLNVIDPRHIPRQQGFRRGVHIEQIHRRPQDLRSIVRTGACLPLVRDGRRSTYTALSLAAPEKEPFRVKVGSRDPDWKGHGHRTEGVLQRSPPRQLPLPRGWPAITAASGTRPATPSISPSMPGVLSDPMVSKASCVAAFLGLHLGTVPYRLHQIAQQFNARLDERVNERTAAIGPRIAPTTCCRVFRG